MTKQARDKWLLHKAGRLSPPGTPQSGERAKSIRRIDISYFPFHLAKSQRSNINLRPKGATFPIFPKRFPIFPIIPIQKSSKLKVFL